MASHCPDSPRRLRTRLTSIFRNLKRIFRIALIGFIKICTERGSCMAYLHNDREQFKETIDFTYARTGRVQSPATHRYRPCGLLLRFCRPAWRRVVYIHAAARSRPVLGAWLLGAAAHRPSWRQIYLPTFPFASSMLVSGMQIAQT